MHTPAVAIQKGAALNPVAAALPQEDEDEVDEGRVLYRLHRARERNRSIVKKKRATVLAEGGSLACEACGLGFSAMYGRLGGDYIEVHHRVPLHAVGPDQDSTGRPCPHLRQLTYRRVNCG